MCRTGFIRSVLHTPTGLAPDSYSTSCLDGLNKQVTTGMAGLRHKLEVKLRWNVWVGKCLSLSVLRCLVDTRINWRQTQKSLSVCDISRQYGDEMCLSAVMVSISNQIRTLYTWITMCYL